MTAAEIAAACGSARRSGHWWRCVCPVHGSRSGRGLSLALRDGDRGLVVHCHAGCDARDIFAEVRRRGLIGGGAGDAVRPASAAARNEDRADTVRRIALAQRIWTAAKDARGTPIERYLAGRGIMLPVPPSLRWAPRCWNREALADLPAMVACVEHVGRGFVGCHRTYLTADHHRRDRASLGPIGGGAVRLATMRPDDWLVIGEGIETVLSVMHCTGLPGWAALSAGGVEQLVLPLAARLVLIVADHDANGTAERAARLAAERWVCEGRRVKIAMSPEPGTDLNNVLLGLAHARITKAHDVAA